ncbi:MAG: xanthine dehydrogenase family protein molybdopterin-binding subunit, partial [Chloroflexota bacterium]
NQGAFSVREQVADILQQSIGKLKVVPMEIGGGFGGKIFAYLEPIAAVLSRKSGRPVQLTMSRADVFEATGPAPGTSIRLKMGATREGRIVAAQADMAYEAGAFPGSAIWAGCLCILAPYDVENVLIDGYDVVVNKPKTSAYRAPGAPQAAFAAETMVDELAERLGMDPLEFRLRNASHEGTRQVNGQTFRRVGHIECLEAARATEHYRSPISGTNGSHPADARPEGTGRPALPRGRGVASGFWFNAGMKSSASASINPDGSVSLIEGSTDIGGTRASIAMQLAETLGISAEQVHPAVGDTDAVGFTAVTGGSRTTFATGWAAYEVAMDLRRQLVDRAATFLEIPAEDLVYEDGAVHSVSLPQRRMTFQELAERVNREGAPVVGRATVSPNRVGAAFATHIVDLEVDPETGKVNILRYTAVQDVGTAIHPAYVEGQMQGGVAQGIGWALNEEYYFDEAGVMRNASFLDYRMPTSLDLPAIDTIIVEVPNPGHPYGVRGCGEVPIVPPIAAVANALHNALGTRFTHLPMSPRHILEQTVL